MVSIDDLIADQVHTPNVKTAVSKYAMRPEMCTPTACSSPPIRAPGRLDVALLPTGVNGLPPIACFHALKALSHALVYLLWHGDWDGDSDPRGVCLRELRTNPTISRFDPSMGDFVRLADGEGASDRKKRIAIS